jgi:hypothetical protein
MEPERLYQLKQHVSDVDAEKHQQLLCKTRAYVRWEGREEIKLLMGNAAQALNVQITPGSFVQNLKELKAYLSRPFKIVDDVGQVTEEGRHKCYIVFAVSYKVFNGKGHGKTFQFSFMHRTNLGYRKVFYCADGTDVSAGDKVRGGLASGCIEQVYNHEFDKKPRSYQLPPTFVKHR